VTIESAESIAGTVREVSYKRNMPCDSCKGNKIIVTMSDDVCPKCNGSKTRTYGGSEKSLPCTACGATGKLRSKQKCDACEGKGVVSRDFKAKFKIPPGTSNGAQITLEGYGHYSSQGLNQWSDAIVLVFVKSDPDIERRGDNLVSILKVSLIEALKGTVKDVKTINGTQSLKIPGPRKHGDKITAAGLGVPPRGSHIFVLNVEYPENTDSLIEFLEGDKPDEDGYIEDKT